MGPDLANGGNLSCPRGYSQPHHDPPQLRQASKFKTGVLVLPRVSRELLPRTPPLQGLGGAERCSRKGGGGLE